MNLLDFLFGTPCEHDFENVGEFSFTREVDFKKQEEKFVLYECTKCGKRKYISTCNLFLSDLSLNLDKWKINDITTEEFKTLYSR